MLSPKRRIRSSRGLASRRRRLSRRAGWPSTNCGPTAAPTLRDGAAQRLARTADNDAFTQFPLVTIAHLALEAPDEIVLVLGGFKRRHLIDGSVVRFDQRQRSVVHTSRDLVHLVDDLAADESEERLRLRQFWQRHREDVLRRHGEVCELPGLERAFVGLGEFSKRGPARIGLYRLLSSQRPVLELMDFFQNRTAWSSHPSALVPAPVPKP